jgi:cell division protein FtsB
MNIYIHEDFVKEKARRARRMQTIGMVLIAISFLFSFSSLTGSTTYLIFLAYPFLLVGFPLWTMGRSAQRRLSSSPHADTMLNAELKGLNNKYSLHHFIRYGDTRIHHLLVTPSGLIVINSSDATGPVTCSEDAKGDNWKSPTNLLDRMTGLKPPVGNITQELDASVAAVREVAEKIGKPDVPVKGLALFTRNPDVQIHGCKYQGVPMSEVRQAIRELQQDMDNQRDDARDVSTLLTSEDRRRLNTFLAPETVKVQPNAAPSRR